MANVAADLLVHVGADIGDATRGLSDIGSKVDGTGAKFQKASFVMAGGSAAIIGGLGASVMAAANFEQGMAEVAAVSNLTGQEFDQLSALAMNIGKSTSFSATEGAAAIAELAKAGLPVSDILNGAAMSASHLAEAGGVGIPQAAEIMSNSMNMFGIAGKDAAVVADTFAAAANASAADVAGLAQGLAQGGPAAASFGMSLDETVASLAMFSNYGIQGSDAGTSLKTMLQRLAAPTDEAAALMGELGIQAFDAGGNFVGMEALSGQLQTALGDMSEEQRNAALTMMFGADASRVAGIMAKEGAAGFREMHDATKDQGAAGRMAAKRMDTLMGSIEQLKGSLETAMIVIGTGMIPVIRGLADGVLGLVNGFLAMNPNVQKFVGIAMAAAAGALAIGAAVAGIVGFVGPAAAGFFALLTPIGLLITVGALLFAAWQTNFGGMRDIIQGIIDPIKTFGEMFLKVAGDIFGSSTKIEGVMFLFRQFPEPIQKVARGLLLLVDAFGDIYRAISNGTGVMDAFKASIGQIGQGLGTLGSGILSAIAGIDWAGIGTAIWNGLVTAVGYVVDITPDIVSKLGDLTLAIGGWITDKAGAVDWGGLLSSAAASAGDITGDILTGIGNLTGTLGAWLWQQASAVDWGGLLSMAAGAAGDITGTIVGKLGDLTASLSTWLTSRAGAVNWGGLLSEAASTAGDITGTIVGKLGDLGTALRTWLTTAASAIPWDSIGNGAGNVVSNVVSKIGDLGTGLKTWYDNAINSVNWGGMGESIGAKIGSLATTLAPKAAELVTGLTTAITENWQTIGTVLAGLFLGLPATIAYLGATLAPKALEFIQGFVTGLGINWPLVGTWLSGLPGKILAAIPGLTTAIGSKATELLTGFGTALGTAWTSTVVPWLSTMGAKALAAVPGLTAALTARGRELITGVYTAASQYWSGSVVPWLARRGSEAFGAVGSLLASLPGRGRELLQGFSTALTQFWDGTIVPQLRNIGPGAVSAVGSLIGTLRQAGMDLMSGLGSAMSAGWASYVQPGLAGMAGAIAGYGASFAGSLVDAGWGVMRGFLQGLQGGWGEVTGWLSGLNPADWKGPEARDKAFLIKPGIWTMEGYMEGLEKGWGDVTRQLSSYTPTLSSDSMVSVQAEAASNRAANRIAATNANPRGGSTIIYQTNQFDVHVDELEDVVEAARFVRDIDTSRTLYFEGGF